MDAKIKRAVIISGAPEHDIDYFNYYIKNSFIISADSGYNKCAKLGITPDLIIGDFDSSKKPNCLSEIIELPVRKDDTDTFYAVKEAVRRGFKEIFIIGGIGSRFDHTYANVLSVYYAYENGVSCKLVNMENCISVLDKSAIVYSDGYRYFSLYALFEECTGVSVIGASFEAKDVTLKPYEQFAQSNEFVGDSVSINIEKGKLLLIKSND